VTIKKLLVANRGEIAVRVIRAARELGISTVAVCSEADRDAVHVRAADEHVFIGPAPATKSYLNVDALIGAVEMSGADAVHPGYGFLSENAEFADRVVAAGAVWVGPSSHAIRMMGDKAQARATAKAAGVPTVPGSDGPVEDAAAASAVAQKIGYPVVIKAAAGGGGCGIRVVADADELVGQLPVAQAEAAAAFGSGAVYIERFVPAARHLEVQVLGDGNRFVHLGERDCSLQRRRQKVMEEAGAPHLPEVARAGMCAAAVRLATAVDYSGAGTVEFLYDPGANASYFIEMNTRIQVEHPITEMITGRDLVQEQLLIASGNPLSFSQEEILFCGHAIEIRVNAENPDWNFVPSPGRLEVFRLPSGAFVRVDSGYEAGGEVSPYYDSLLAKVIVWGRTRDEALNRMRRALDEVDVQGVATTADFLRKIIDLPELRAGGYHTTFLEDWMAQEARTP
jgi:acetyl-CoA carboxylase biotin carboxylase subunit